MAEGLFCRHNEYQVSEMLQRLSNKIISKEVIQKDVVNKQEGIKEFLNTYHNDNEMLDRLKICFEKYGRKGDKANIKIFKVNKFRESLLTEHGLSDIENLLGNNLSSKEIIGTFFDVNCILEKIFISENILDFRFGFQYEKIIPEEDTVKIEIINRYIEARFYMDKRIICITDGYEKERQAIIKFILSIPYYILIKQTNEFTYSEPDFSEIELNTEQLDTVKVLLGGKLKAAVIEVFGDKGVRIKIEGNDEEFENESYTYNNNKNSGNKEELQIFWEDSEGNKNKVTIKKDCQIVTTNYLTIQAMETIIESIMISMKAQKLIIPTENFITKYCSKNFRPARRIRMFAMIEENLYSSVEEIVENLMDINGILKRKIDRKELIIAFNIVKNNLENEGDLEGNEYNISNDFIFKFLEVCNEKEYNKLNKLNSIYELEKNILNTKGNLKDLLGVVGL